MTLPNPNPTPSLRSASLVALGTAGSLALLVSAVGFGLSSLLIRPPIKRTPQQEWSHLVRFIRQLGIQFEDIAFASFDHTQLRGWWMAASRQAPTVIILHGLTKNRTDVIRTVLVLRRAGFNVLVFDGRGHGHSEGCNVTYGFYERLDVEWVIDSLVRRKQIDRNRVGLAGESMGAAVALQVAAGNPWIRAVWADSSFSCLPSIAREWVQRVTGLPGAVLSPFLWTSKKIANLRGRFDIDRVAPANLAPAIKCPVFLVHGAADHLVKTAHSERIYQALTDSREIWIVEGARHARAARQARLEYSERILKFFSAHLQ